MPKFTSFTGGQTGFAGSINKAPKLNAFGGTPNTVGNYKIHTFTSSGTFKFFPTSISLNTTLDILVVGAGGGSIGVPVQNASGGGGAGGVVYNTSFYQITAAGTFTITIGAGVAGANGQDTTVSGPGITTITAIGGGCGGGNATGGGANGGSGGGGSNTTGAGGAALQPGSASGGYGSNGLNGGNGLSAARGGGAGADGWNGRAFDISGATTYYGGGGGRGRKTGQGGGESVQSLGGGGWGGGGSGPGGAATAGDPNTGGGAGGNGSIPVADLAGGSGIVIIRYIVV